MAADIDWLDKFAGGVVAIVAGLFAWIGRVVYGNFKTVEELKLESARLTEKFTAMEDNHEERKQMITDVSVRLDAQAEKLDHHIDATTIGFNRLADKIDAVKDQVIEAIRAK